MASSRSLPEVAVLLNVFQELRVTAALVKNDHWRVLFGAPNVVEFEIAHGTSMRRAAHNKRSIHRALRRGEPLVAEHAGFLDLFAPLRDAAGNVLVAGPFRGSRPSAVDLRSQWRALTRGKVRDSDPEFGRFAAMALDTTVFEADKLRAFKSFAGALALLLGGTGNTERLVARASAEQAKLVEIRRPERTWEDVASMLDQRSFRGWSSFYNLDRLRFLGLDGLPEHVVVGLLSSSGDEAEPIHALVQRDLLQRAGVEVARRLGHTVCGRVGDYGLVFLVRDTAKGRSRLQAKLLDAGERMRKLAREFGFRMHLGVSSPDHDAELPARYQGATLAAERALYGGLSHAFAQPSPQRATSPLGDLRRELVRSVATNPSAVGMHFDRFLEAVAAHTRHRLEATRAHAEAGFDQVVDALGASEVLDARSLADLREALDRPAEAGTVRDLLLAYRRTMTELERTVFSPKAASHDRSLARALAFVRDHLSEPLPLARVAKVAGFAPAYFSRLFAATQKQTFQSVLSQLRVERAKQMLETSNLSVERIGKLSGFRTPARFHSVFLAQTRVTPATYRRLEKKRTRWDKRKHEKRQ